MADRSDAEARYRKALERLVLAAYNDGAERSLRESTTATRQARTTEFHAALADFRSADALRISAPPAITAGLGAEELTAMIAAFEVDYPSLTRGAMTLHPVAYCAAPLAEYLLRRLGASAPPAIPDANGLLPCPRGGDGKHHKVWVQDEPMMSGPNKYRVLCLAMPSCWSGPIMGTKADAIAAWNRRASAPRQEPSIALPDTFVERVVRTAFRDTTGQSDLTVMLSAFEASAVRRSVGESLAEAYKRVAAPPPEER